MECCSSDLRDLMGMLLGLPFSVAVVGFAGVAFFLRSWQDVFMVGASPVLLVIPFAFMMDESPRWLLQTGRVEEARAVLERAVKLNNTKLILPLTETIDELIKASSRDPPAPDSTWRKPSQALSLLRGTKEYLSDPAMRRIIFATAGIWFIHDTLYLGVALSAHNFSRKVYLLFSRGNH
ncbi:solute carrier family 22 member 20-like [Penaeus chinensis]|uniref:solute carrier family 22 member 20-like n=1 Tax=Penaeus chinensis TaxID=139456 RepID=UPI001FB790FA|nr:solute carrier family 22 member 20-like [Penaeus chinensis]